MKKLLLSIMTAAVIGNGALLAAQAAQPAADNPFSEIEQVQQEMDAIFQRLHQKLLNDPALSEFGDTFTKTPATDLMDKGDHYLIKADIPGVDEKSIKVTEKDGQLTIEAETVKEKKEKKKNYVHQERFVNKFVKILTLPKDADASKLKTSYKNGVLEVKIPKRK